MNALAGALLVSLLVGAAGLGAAGVLTIATFTSLRDLVRRPLSTLPTEPIDLDSPPTPAGRHRRRIAHARTDLSASLRAAAGA